MGKIPISKKELKKYVKQRKTTKAIARHFKVSKRTIYRRIKEYGLKGIRPKGRKPFVRKPKFPKPIKKWIYVKEYIDNLNDEYHFINIHYPPFRYINPKTLVCSNRKGNPKGKFTTVGIWYIALESYVYFLFPISVRYTEKPIPFKQIYKWSRENAYDMVLEFLRKTDVSLERIVAFTFLERKNKPKRMKGS